MRCVAQYPVQSLHTCLEHVHVLESVASTLTFVMMRLLTRFPPCSIVAQVRLAEGDKWQDVEYLKHTSLKTYMPYMMGGGYVLSADLAHVILGINQQVLRCLHSCSTICCVHLHLSACGDDKRAQVLQPLLLLPICSAMWVLQLMAFPEKLTCWKFANKKPWHMRRRTTRHC